MAKADRFWTGTIATREHASKIVSYMVGALAVITALSMLSLFSGPDVSKVLVTLTFGALALSLHRTRSVITAGLLLALVGVCTALAAIAGLYLVAQGGPTGWMALGVSLFWFPFTFASWRAFAAARVLMRLAQSTAVAIR